MESKDTKLENEESKHPVQEKINAFYDAIKEGDNDISEIESSI